MSLDNAKSNIAKYDSRNGSSPASDMVSMFRQQQDKHLNSLSDFEVFGLCVGNM